MSSVLDLIESVKDQKVLFVGDSIIDEYCYVEALGKSPKEHLIPVRYGHEEFFQGGVHAAARHAMSFCHVEVIASNSAVRKVRYVDRNYMRKLFEVHYGSCERLDRPLRADMVAVTDFGHGFITSVSDEFHSAGLYLAVAAQTNSSNVGFNLITKYPSADYIVIDEPEARLAAADRESPIESVMRQLAAGRCKKMIVTHGQYGAYGLENGRFVHQKAFPNHPVDTMGAGDAFFAVTAPMAKTGKIEDLLLIGNAAGALKCGIVGHREPVTKKALIDFLTHAPR